jgi:hypothetical protein
MDLFFAKIKGKVLILIQLVLKKSKQFIFIFQELELLSCHFNNYLSGILPNFRLRNRIASRD